jgi:hypothetical protein
MSKQLWLTQIEKLRVMLVGMGYTLHETTDAEDSVLIHDREVLINSRSHPETRFYTILHEIGHIMVAENSDQFSAEVPMYVHSADVPDDGRRERGKAYRVSLIAEEIEAWKLGRRFATTMGLWINNEKYNKHMTDALISYIEWGAR